MDMDIDMDIDIDLQFDGNDQMDAQEATSQNNGPSALSFNINLPDDPLSRESAEPVLDKVHIRGLDHLSSAELKYYAGEHYSLDEFERIEWIDDTSANMIYSTAQAASEALLALTNAAALNMDAHSIPALQLRPAKGLSMRPEADLYIRQGTSIDVKRKGAHEASRYYLLNPEQDPRERKRQQETRRSRGGRGGVNGNSEYNRREFDDYEHKRRRDDAANGFDADMYDDDAGAEAGFSAHSSEVDRRKRPRARRSKEDLFADRLGKAPGSRLRGRSASPMGDGDGRLGFGDDLNGSRARRTRHRSRSPPRAPKASAVKELFPSLTPAQQSRAPKELFPTLASPSGMRSAELAPTSPVDTRLNRNSLELIPNKRGSFSHHRRTAAFDSTPGRERSLAERITGRPSTAPSDEIRIRGAAENGIQIRGIANQQPPPSVRELFPLKAGSNSGKELFGEKIKGRGGPRRRAEDMFS